MISDKKVVAITLARGGSKSIPRKNIAIVGHQPLIAYTIQAAQQSKYIDEYHVSTEDEEIARVSSSFGASIIQRPTELSQDNSPSSMALIHAVEHVDCDYVVELMATNPVKTSADIDACIEKLHETGCESVVSVVRVFDHHPARVKYIENDVLMDFFPEKLESRRQELKPPAYVRNGSIYAMTKKFLLGNQVRYNKRTRPYVMPVTRSINIDEPIDLYVAEKLLEMSNEDPLSDAS